MKPSKSRELISTQENIKSMLAEGNIEGLKSEFEKQKSSSQKEDFASLVNNTLLESDKCNYIDMTIKIVIFLLDHKLSSKEDIEAAIKRFNSVLQKESYLEKHEFKKENKSGKSKSIQSSGKKERKEQGIRKIILILESSLKSEIDFFITKEFAKLLSENEILRNLEDQKSEEEKIDESLKTKIADIISDAAIKFIYNIQCDDNKELQGLVKQHNKILKTSINETFLKNGFTNFHNQLLAKNYKDATETMIVRAKHLSNFFNEFTIITRQKLEESGDEFKRLTDGIESDIAKRLDKELAVGIDEKLYKNIQQFIEITAKNYPYSLMGRNIDDCKAVEGIFSFIKQYQKEITEDKDLTKTFELFAQHQLLKAETVNLEFFSRIQGMLTEELLREEGETSTIKMIKEGNKSVKKGLEEQKTELSYENYIKKILGEKKQQLPEIPQKPAGVSTDLRHEDSISLKHKEELKNITGVENSPTQEEMNNLGLKFENIRGSISSESIPSPSPKKPENTSIEANQGKKGGKGK